MSVNQALLTLLGSRSSAFLIIRAATDQHSLSISVPDGWAVIDQEY
jgi:uncharacterized protein YbdZ (MbtH family)